MSNQSIYCYALEQMHYKIHYLVIPAGVMQVYEALHYNTLLQFNAAIPLSMMQ